MTERLDLDTDLKLYGWSAADVKKVQDWLRSQNFTIDDLDGRMILWRLGGPNE